MYCSERLRNEPASSAASRRIVERFAGEVDRGTLDDLRLLVSEVVSNAIEHVGGDGDIELAIGVEDGVVRVEVLDRGQGFVVRPRQPGDPQGSGWGLHFVERLSQRWGTDVGERARVWFELPARVPARRA